MPGRARLDAPGTLHQVIVRGIEERRIVDVRWDRGKCCHLLESRAERPWVSVPTQSIGTRISTGTRIGSDAEHRNQDKQNPLVPIMSAAILARVSLLARNIDQVYETDLPREIDASHHGVYFTGAR